LPIKRYVRLVEKNIIKIIYRGMFMDLRYQKKKERFDRNFKKISNKTIESLKETDRDYNINYFYNCLENLFVKQKMDYLNQKPLIGTFCAMVPDELIIACGGQPVKLCGGNYISQFAGDEFAPRDCCPVVKSSIGNFSMDLLPIYSACKLAIVPASCDGKKKMAEIIAKYIPTVSLHIPALKDEESFNEMISIYAGLIDVIETKTGQKLTRHSFKKAIKLIGKINQQASILMDFKKMKPTVISGAHAMAVINSYQYSDREVYLKELTKLNKSLEAKVKQNKIISKNPKRILITGSPMVFPNLKIPLILEDLGAIISADETCAGDRMLADPVNIREITVDAMIKGVVMKSILPCSCPTFAYNEDRIYRLKQMVEDYKIDGIVYNVLRGCLPYDFEVRNVEKLSEQIGIPVIRVESDYNTEDTEQIKIRLEAFVEMLKMKKR